MYKPSFIPLHIVMVQSFNHHTIHRSCLHDRILMHQVPLLIERGQPSAADECLTEPPHLLVCWICLQRDTGKGELYLHIANRLRREFSGKVKEASRLRQRIIQLCSKPAEVRFLKFRPLSLKVKSKEGKNKSSNFLTTTT